MAESCVNMAVDLGGVKMQNPVNTASGTFGFGWQFEGFFDVSRLGAITTKGCSAEPWLGNPEPRMCEVPSGMMNTPKASPACSTPLATIFASSRAAAAA